MTRKTGLTLVGVLLALSLVWGCGQASPTTKELDTEKTATNFHKDVVRGGYQVVTTPELKMWIDKQKDMLIVDTTPIAVSYQKNHVPGAKQFEFPIPEMKEMTDAQKAAFIKVLGDNKDKMIVFYCGFVKCTRSHNGAMWAKKLGYKNVYRQPGGIKAWKEAGYPVEKAK